MSLVQRSMTILKKFLHPRSGNHVRNETIAYKMMEDSGNNIVWIDMEMTGLDIETCHILEVACLVTDSNLKIISQEFNTVINHPDDILNNMSEWCIKQHGESGLTDACRNSKLSLKKVEEDLLRFVKTYVPEKKCPLAGSSIYMDRLFLLKYMPRVNDYLHYRIIDTSSIKEITRRWNYKVYENAPKKSLAHRAMDDIKESIRELRYYKDNAFKTNDTG